MRLWKPLVLGSVALATVMGGYVAKAGTGGSEDGAVGETLRVDSPLEANPEAGAAESAADDPEVRESLDNVLEMTDAAVTQAYRAWRTRLRAR